MTRARRKKQVKRKNIRHQGYSNGVEEQSSQGHKAGYGRAQTPAAGQEAGEESHDGEEQADEI